MMQNNLGWKQGAKDGLPIALGYLSVSFTFGMAAAAAGLSAGEAVMISATNLTSAGQFAGLTLIQSQASLFEMALTTLVINLRYALMSLSLAQKLDPAMSRLQKAMLAFGNTDEIFAVAVSHPVVQFHYMLGLILTPMAGWVGGTFLGCAFSALASGSGARGLRRCDLRDVYRDRRSGCPAVKVRGHRRGNRRGNERDASCLSAVQLDFRRFFNHSLYAGRGSFGRLAVPGSGGARS